MDVLIGLRNVKENSKTFVIACARRLRNLHLKLGWWSTCDVSSLFFCMYSSKYVVTYEEYEIQKTCLSGYLLSCFFLFFLFRRVDIMLQHKSRILIFDHPERLEHPQRFRRAPAVEKATSCRVIKKAGSGSLLSQQALLPAISTLIRGIQSEKKKASS